MSRARTPVPCLALLLSLTAVRFGAAASGPRPIELADVMAWRAITASAVSDDGAWFGYHVGPAEGDGDVVFRKTAAEKQHTFPAGEVAVRAAAPAFSSDGKFAAFVIYPTREEAAKLKRQRRPLQNKLGIVELESGAKVEVAKVRRFALSPAGGWIAIHKYAPDPPGAASGGASAAAGGSPPAAAGRAAAASTPQRADLLLRELGTGQQIVIGNVSEFAFDKQGRFLAWTVDAEDKSGNGLQLRDMQSGAVRSLESDDKAVYSRMSWSEDGEALALLKGLDGRAPGEMRYFVVGLSGFGPGGPKKTVFNPVTAPDFPADMIVSPNRNPIWTRDRSALLFGIQKPVKAAPAASQGAGRARDRSASPDAAAAPDDAAAEDKVDLVLWHWRDKRLQSQQKVQETQDRNRNFLAEYKPADKKFIRLADEAVADVQPAPGERFAIGRDDTAYELAGNLDGRRFQDIYVVDLTTGKRTLAVKQSRWTYSPSPTGTHFLYYDDGHYYAYDMASEKATNITRALPASFIDTEDDHPVEKPPTRFLGWSTDGKSVLLSDNWDIWQVPVTGSGGVNLTLSGSKEQVRHRRPVDFSPDERGFDLTKPLYVELYGEWTKKGGVGVVEPGKPGVKRLLWDDASYFVPPILKAQQAGVYLFTRQTYKDPPDFYVAGPSLAAARKLTNLAAGTEQFLWSSGSMLVDYVSDKGEKLQAALYLPANYEKGKTYPTVVNIYERMSANLNEYSRHTGPNQNGFNKSMYTSHGYAVLAPDIRYTLNDPGMSAVWCVLPAVKAAIAKGVVDPKRVGITGHSWGAFQTTFLIGQTDTFAAAVASAPVTDWFSMYDLIYKATGAANAPISESNQGRLASGPWDNPEAYLRNSPVMFVKNVKTPLLMLHNEKDGAVDFTQGVEYFNALRRLQKPVVMLEYPGETHGLGRRINWKDYQLRVQEFFDHFLQGKPAPKWWNDGVPFLEMEEHLKTRQPAKASPPAAGSQ